MALSTPTTSEPAGRTLVNARARWISVAMIAASPLITAVMSILFYGEVRGGMLVTSIVCAVVIDRIVQHITRSFRQRLREAHDTLERRVQERTRELQIANETLHAAAVEQEALRDELVARDRLATAGMLGASVSHEIRSPLTVIRFALDSLAEERRTLPAELQELVVDAGDAATRIEVILRDLTSLARPAEDPVGPTDLAPAIDRAVRLASYRLGKGVRLERDPLDVPTVHANASRLVQVFLNLITNAARATRPDALNRIRIGARREGGRVVVAIADTGCGMTDEVRARIFQPFFTTGRETGGTGLGLMICRTMIERMGGTLEITTAPGVGTTAEVTLDACAA